MKMEWLRDERGQVLVMTVFSLGILLGALGLAIDVGVLFHERRHVQTVADAAAMAGATELFYNGSGNVATKVYAAALANGVDNTVAGNTVLYTVGPTLPDGTVCSSCVLARVATTSHAMFIDAMMDWQFQSKSYDKVPVAAKAVAGAPGISQNCAWIMDPTAPSSLWIHGAGDINAPNCGVYVNSNDPGALCVTGNAGKSNFAQLNVVGGQGSKGNCKGNPGPPVNTGVGVQSPPLLAKLPATPATNCTSVNNVTSLSGTIAGPGYGNYACYANSGGGPVSLNATMGPGIYVFETGVSVSGNTVVGNGSGTTTATNGGATIVISGPSSGTYGFDSSSATNLTVYAPTSGTYNGVAIYQPSSDSQAIELQFGSSSSYFMGAVVAPSAAVDLHDHGGAVNATNLIVGQAYINGVVNLQNYSSYNASTTPFTVLTMVE